MASQAGLDLVGVSGTGPNGRIVKADVEAAIAGGASAAPAAPTTAEKLPLEPEFELEAHSTMRKTIARLWVVSHAEMKLGACEGMARMNRHTGDSDVEATILISIRV